MKINGKNLKAIRSELKLSQLEMANTLGIDRATYLRYEKDNKFPDKKEEFYFSIISDMLKDKSGYVEDPDMQKVPLYDIEASASVVEIFSDRNDVTPIDYIKIPNLPRCDGAMPIRGDSMYPLLKSGDIILYKILNDKHNIIWGQMYIVYINNNGDDFLLTKFLKKSEKEGYVQFISQNQHHEPVEFPMDSIQAIAQIQASIRINTTV